LEKLLVVDCKGVITITDHSLDELFKSIAKVNREITFVSCQQIEEKLSNAKKEFCNELNTNDGDSQLTIYKRKQKQEFTSESSNEVKSKIIKNIKEFVSKSFQKFPDGKFKRLSSTPILASGEYDASSLISNPASFYWISLSLLDKVEEIIERDRVGKKSQAKLLSVSLRAAPFASAISLLGGFQLECIDHLGPINPYSKLMDQQYISSDYIYIGDFVFGGTEIKVAKNYLNFKSSLLGHAVTIGSLFSDDTFKDFQLSSLVSLNSLNVDAKYKMFED